VRLAFIFVGSVTEPHCGSVPSIVSKPSREDDCSGLSGTRAAQCTGMFLGTYCPGAEQRKD
jgi:hypothetical protein